MMKMKRIIALALTTLALLGIALSAMAGTVNDNSPGKIVLSDTVSGNCNMRNNPLDSTGNSIVARLGHGTTLTVIRSATGYSANGSTKWYYVSIKTPNNTSKNNANATSGQTGYVHSSYVEQDTATPAPTTPPSWPPPIGAMYCGSRNGTTYTTTHNPYPVGSDVGPITCQVTTKYHTSMWYGHDWTDSHAGEVTHTYSGCGALNRTDCSLQYKAPWR